MATTPHTKDCDLIDFDISKKSAFFFGVEKAGLSNFVMDNADGFLKIPMVGFTESLNISVSAAIIIQNLTNRLRQTDINWQLSEKEILEIALIEKIRAQFNASQITIRVDANGAFSPDEIEEKLLQLKDLDVHSIEQPIQSGQLEKLSHLCKKNILPLALDEELIGISTREERRSLLDFVCPQFIVLKPSLHGGFYGCKEWIELAEERSISWWITSALESSIGLNAISQFTGNYPIILPQGLGTGGLYTNNLPSKLVIKDGFLKMSV